MVLNLQAELVPLTLGVGTGQVHRGFQVGFFGTFLLRFFCFHEQFEKLQHIGFRAFLSGDLSFRG